MTKWQLFSMLGQNGNIPCDLRASDNSLYCGVVVQTIQRESGNGHCFNVEVSSPSGKTFWVYVRTID
jgi:hypothetical protein